MTREQKMVVATFKRTCRGELRLDLKSRPFRVRVGGEVVGYFSSYRAADGSARMESARQSLSRHPLPVEVIDVQYGVCYPARGCYVEVAGVVGGYEPAANDPDD